MWSQFKLYYFLLDLNRLLTKKRAILVEPTYTGVTVKFPIFKQNFHDLVNSFKLHKVSSESMLFI